MIYPQGKGLYVWQIANVLHGDTNQMIAAAHDLGLQWVSFKVAQGGFPYQPGIVAPTVKAFQQAGFKVWGWAYVVGTDGLNDISEMEAIQAANQINTLGLEGLMIDGEGEYQSQPNARGLASNYIRTLLARIDTTKIGVGLNSFRYVSVHGPFPFKEFLAGCSFHIPQVYWEKDDSPGGEVRELVRSIAELQVVRQLPYIPLGIACMDSGWKPTPDQIAQFNQGALDRGCPGIGWYEWAAMNAQVELAQAVKDTSGWDGSPPAPIPPPVIDPTQRYLSNAQAALDDLRKGKAGSYTPAA